MQKPEKFPSFPFYPKDWIADENVKVMEPAQRGHYIDLMCFCWLEGTIPADINRVRRLLRDKGGDDAWWQEILQCFRKHPKNKTRLIHPKLEKLRAEYLDHRDKRREAGSKGAEKRWHSHSKAIEVPMAKDALSLSSSLSPSLSMNNKSAKPTIQRKEIKGMSEAMKQKCVNEMKKVFKARGWKEGLIEKAFNSVADKVNRYKPKNVYPYFKKAFDQYVNENAEGLNSESRSEKEKPIESLKSLTKGIGK